MLNILAKVGVEMRIAKGLRFLYISPLVLLLGLAGNLCLADPLLVPSPENLPLEVAQRVRERQGKGSHKPKYSVPKTEKELREIMDSLGIKQYIIHISKIPGNQTVNYGIWLQFHKPVDRNGAPADRPDRAGS